MKNQVFFGLIFSVLINPTGGDCSHDCSKRAYNPLCGEDGKVYPNPCSSNCMIMKIDYTWERCDTCSFLCTEQLDPVCGSDGKIYSNRCFLLLKSCKHNGEIVEVPSTHCCFSPECKESVQCGEICERLIELQRCFNTCKDDSQKPICGTDGQFYAHECFLGCKSQTASQNPSICDRCDRFCPYIYTPVCGSNRVIYANLCLLENANCRSGKKIKESSMRKCCRKKKNCPPPTENLFKQVSV